jgi:hypothetical protein
VDILQSDLRQGSAFFFAGCGVPKKGYAGLFFSLSP